MLLITNFLEIAKGTPEKLNNLPELQFLLPLGAAIKQKGCLCGLGKELQEANDKFNELIPNLTPEQIARFKTELQSESLSFGVQKIDGFYEVKY